MKESMRVAIKQSKKIGMTLKEARETAEINDDLYSDYLSTDFQCHCIAAYRIRALLDGDLSEGTIDCFLSLFLNRLSVPEYLMDESDMEISIALWNRGKISVEMVKKVVQSIQGRCDFFVAAASKKLIPIIGTEFLEGYLRSGELFETEGMGGPKKPLLRIMAQEALEHCEKEMKGPTSRWR